MNSVARFGEQAKNTAAPQADLRLADGVPPDRHEVRKTCQQLPPDDIAHRFNVSSK